MIFTFTKIRKSFGKRQFRSWFRANNGNSFGEIRHVYACTTLLREKLLNESSEKKEKERNILDTLFFLFDRYVESSVVFETYFVEKA